MLHPRRLIAAVAVLAVLGAAPPRPTTLTVFAAASLTDAFNELGDTLMRRSPGLHVDFNYAGSQLLAVQIKQGALVDVFASADDRWMTDVRDSGFVAGEPRTFIHNRLVLIVPKSNPARIDKLQDLARAGVKLVLAADRVPAGRYARLMLWNLGRVPGFVPDFGQRVLHNVVSNEDNVRSVATKVQLGEADAGIVYVSDVTADVARHVRRWEIPDAYNVVASYPIAIVRNAPQPDLARAFIDLVLSPVGQGALVRHGFLPLEAQH